MARALDAAHRAGIVHRDLKPGNIMLTKAGAKLLDFSTWRRSRSRGSMPTRASLLGAVLKDEPPPMSTVRPDAPAALDRIVATCLATITSGDIDNAQVAALDLETGQQKTLIRGGSSAEYVESGHRVYAAAGTLRAVSLVWVDRQGRQESGRHRFRGSRSTVDGREGTDDAAHADDLHRS